MAKTKKVIKVTRKVNNKDVSKNEVMEIVTDALEKAGLTIKDGVDYGMTKGTIIVEHEHSDVQIKPISPKAGIDRYQKVVYEYVDK